MYITGYKRRLLAWFNEWVSMHPHATMGIKKCAARNKKACK